MKGGQYKVISPFALENCGSEGVRVHGLECLERDSFSTNHREQVRWPLRTPVDLSFLAEPSPSASPRFEGLKPLPVQR